MGNKGITRINNIRNCKEIIPFYFSFIFQFLELKYNMHKNHFLNAENLWNFYWKIKAKLEILDYG